VTTAAPERSIRIGVLGCGNVGAAFVDLVGRQADSIAARTGLRLEVARVAVRNLSAQRDVSLAAGVLTRDALDVVNDPGIDLVVEVIGGIEPARELIVTALRTGKPVVTANKELLANVGAELFTVADESGVDLLFEAAVAGGIPVIRALRESLRGEPVRRVMGIINGTTNFILSEMRDKGLDFEVVLKEAQRLGYAEADPTFDIEGVDAAHKATIMSAIAFGIPVQFDKAYVEGITKLGAADIKYAEQLGYRIKLLGITKRTDKGVELRVHPSLVPAQRLIANVEGAMNAVMVQGDAVGTTLYYGKGAGAEPTASAVVADLVDITRLHTADPQNRVPHLAFQPDALSNLPVLPMEEVVTSYYLRLRVADQAGVLAKLTGLLADANISIDAILQREADQVSGANQTDVIILTHDTREGNMNVVLKQMQGLPTVLAPIVRIRKEELA